jgi:hypothetical protein
MDVAEDYGELAIEFPLNRQILGHFLWKRDSTLLVIGDPTTTLRFVR